MKRSNVLHVAMLGALVAVPAGVVAQTTTQTTASTDNTGYGTTAAEFLLLGANARGMALGGGYAAMATDIGGLYGNPGALALLKRPAIQGSQLQYVGDTQLNWGGLAIPFGGGSSAIGFQIGSFGFNNQPVYTAQVPDGDGTFYSVNETFVAGTIAKNFSDRFSVGITGKAISDRLGDVSGSAFAVDFGTHFHSQLGGHAVRFAFTLTNLGTSMSYSGQSLNEQIARTAVTDTLPGQGEIPTSNIATELQTTAFGLPTQFRVALGYDVYSAKDARLSLLGEFNQMSSNKAGYGGGAEFAADHIGGTPFGIALRGSYTYNPSLSYVSAGQTYTTGTTTTTTYPEPSDDSNAGLAYGGGITMATKGGFLVGFDYAWRKVGIIGSANFYTVTVGW